MLGAVREDGVMVGSCGTRRIDCQVGIVESGGYSAGAAVTVLAEDDVFFTFGCGTWRKQ